MRSFYKTRLKKNGIIFILGLAGMMITGYEHGSWNGLILQAKAQVRQATIVESRLSVTIWVYNYANLAKKTLVQAEDEIGRIMGEAGVGIEWVGCPVSETEIKENLNCQERMNPQTLGLVVLSKYADRAGKKNHATPLGSADLFAGGHDSHYIYVYPGAMVNPFYRQGFPMPQMFSIAAAHELGHIFLCSSSHATGGLMQARLKQKDWDDASMGRLLFTPQQAELIRSEVSLRRNLQALQTAKEFTPSQESQSNSSKSLLAKGQENRAVKKMGPHLKD